MQKYKRYKSSYLCSTYVFKDSINRVYEVIRGPEHLEKTFKKYNCKIKSLRKESDLFDDIGASFRITLNKVLSYEIIIIEAKNEDNYKMIKCKSTKVYPFNFNYIMKHSLYWCNITKQTVLFEEISFIYPEWEKNQDETFYKSQMQLKFSIIEKYLEKSTVDLNQTESVIINSKFDEVVESVQNWNKFIQLSPKIGDKVIISGDYTKVNCKIRLYSGNEVNKFTVVRNEETYGKKYYELMFDHHNSKAPKQFLKFLFIDINNKQTFLSFAHEFIEPIKFSRIAQMEKLKKFILMELKQNLENRQ